MLCIRVASLASTMCRGMHLRKKEKKTSGAEIMSPCSSLSMSQVYDYAKSMPILLNTTQVLQAKKNHDASFIIKVEISLSCQKLDEGN